MTDQIDLRALRKEIGWKQERLARYLGLDASTISRMERAKKLKGPAAKLLQDLAEAAAAGRADELCPECSETEERAA